MLDKKLTQEEQQELVSELFEFDYIDVFVLDDSAGYEFYGSDCNDKYSFDTLRGIFEYAIEFAFSEGKKEGIRDTQYSIMEHKERKELIDCIHNLMGFFDTPIARLKMPSKDCEEVRQIGRDLLKKYNRDYRGIN